MKESFETPCEHFTFPSIESEAGEFDRVAAKFDIDSSVLLFQARDGRMVDLNEDMWEELKNTDSNRFMAGEWDKVEEFAGMADRNYLDLQEKIASGKTLDAPIIMKYGNSYHLVSGNTRLMVARASGLMPKVLLFEVDTN